MSLEEPRVMGILNVTPDSFSDGGAFSEVERAVAHARQMVAEGAALIDVGGESTRPGALPVSEEEECRRVLPVVRRLKEELGVPVTIDTRRASVAREALEAGADAVNDVSALDDPAMGGVVAAFGAGVVLMHMRGTPQSMQSLANYTDVAGEVSRELSGALERALSAGIARESIVVDPGIGFAKTSEQNLELLARLGELKALGWPVLLGVSRKAFLGALLGGVPPEQRDGATAAACVLGLMQGARIFRVHDVRGVREALVVAEAVRRHAPGALAASAGGRG
jgi:dihydropteroate synthase